MKTVYEEIKRLELLYMCEICNKKFSDKEVCNKREDSHIKPVKINEFKYTDFL